MRCVKPQMPRAGTLVLFLAVLAVFYTGCASKSERARTAVSSAWTADGSLEASSQVQPASEIMTTVRDRKVALGVICTPTEFAEPAMDLLCQGGVRGIFNLAPVHRRPHEGVAIFQLDLGICLEQLAYRVVRNEREIAQPV